jgi:hypothetical protein
MNFTGFNYINANTVRNFDFITIPRALIKDDKFKSLDGNAKLLYGLMLSRTALSAIHLDKFSDENGNIFIIYTVNQVMDDLCVSNKTACKLISDLEKIGLITRKKQGRGNPSLTYVMDFNSVVINELNQEATDCNKKESDVDEIKKCKNYTSRSVNSTSLEVKNLHSSYNNNNYNDIDQSINQESCKDDRLIESEEVLFNEAYIALLNQKKETRLLNRDITKEWFYEKIKKAELSGKTKEMLKEIVVNDYKKGVVQRKITNHLKYMQACIISVLLSFDERIKVRDIKENGDKQKIKKENKFINFEQRKYSEEEEEEQLKKCMEYMNKVLNNI